MYQSIHYLRGAAALSICLTHALPPEHASRALLHGGVDLFFVISGFVIYTATAGRPFSPGDFAMRRFMRIMPLWWVVCAVALLVALLRGSFPPLDETLLSLALIPHVNAAGLVAPVVEVGWTLSFELFFYLIFGLALWAGSARYAVWVLLILVGAGQLLSLPRVAAEVFTSPMLLEFMMGITLAQFVAEGRRPPRWMLPLGLALFSAASWQFGVGGEWRGLVKGLPAALIVAGLLAFEHRVRRSRILGFLGDSSYSLYLVHTLVVAELARLLDRGEYWPAILLASIAAGALVHLTIEKPILRAHKLSRLASSARKDRDALRASAV